MWLRAGFSCPSDSEMMCLLSVYHPKTDGREECVICVFRCRLRLCLHFFRFHLLLPFTHLIFPSLCGQQRWLPDSTALSSAAAPEVHAKTWTQLPATPPQALTLGPTFFQSDFSLRTVKRGAGRLPSVDKPAEGVCFGRRCLQSLHRDSRHPHRAAFTAQLEDLSAEGLDPAPDFPYV